MHKIFFFNMTTSRENCISSSSSETAETSETTLRKMLAALDVQRKSVQLEADAIILELTTPPAEGIPPMGLDTPLVDRDGYPRGDIDIYRARTQRHRFHELKTDHKELERKVESLLLQLARIKKGNSSQKSDAEEQAKRLAPKPPPKYDAASGKWVVSNWDGSVAGVAGGESIDFQTLKCKKDNMNTSSASNDTGRSTVSNQQQGSSAVRSMGDGSEDSGSDPQQKQQQQQYTKPFAKVDSVLLDSPAAKAGIAVGDLITRFGSLHSTNHDRLRKVATMVPQVAAEGGTIEVVVVRRKSDNIREGGDDRDGDAGDGDDG